MMEKWKVDVVIPSYKPGEKFLRLMEMLKRQTYPVHKVIIYNTEEKYFNHLVYGTTFRENYPNVEVTHISRREFDHGKTRNMAAEHAQGDILIFMTDDAVPADTRLVEALVEPLADDRTAVSYARQLPASDCGLLERFTRDFNYPGESCVKGGGDVARLGIKTYFCSNVCAAYKRRVFAELGGFVKYTIFNEDMIFAAGAVKAGYNIAYAADAQVIHSHNYTNMQQFKRNFDLAVSQADHPEVFAGISSEAEGGKYVKYVFDRLKQQKKLQLMAPFIIKSVYKYAGYLLGRRYEKLSHNMILKCTMNPVYWERFWDRKNIPDNVHAGYGNPDS